MLLSGSVGKFLETCHFCDFEGPISRKKKSAHEVWGPGVII